MDLEGSRQPNDQQTKGRHKKLQKKIGALPETKAKPV